MRAKFYSTTGDLEGIEFIHTLEKFLLRGDNLLSGIHPNDLPKGMKFDPEKFYWRRYELRRQEKRCAHYYCVGIVETESREITIEPFYPASDSPVK